MQKKIACPNCSSNIEASDVLWSQLRHQVRAEMEFEFNDGKAAIYRARRELVQKEATLDAQRQSLEMQVSNEVAKTRHEIAAEAKQRTTKTFELEIKVRDQQVIALRKKLQAAQVKEHDLLKRERELDEEKARLQVSVAQLLDVEREKLRQQALKQFIDEQEHKDADQRRLVTDLKRQISDLKRKSESTTVESSQAKSFMPIEDMLLSAFPLDSIEPVPIANSRANILHSVHDSDGLECGAVLWESKRPNEFDSRWLEQLREERKLVGAHFAVLVTESLPEGIVSFGMIDGVWVTSWKWAKNLAAALRIGLIEISTSHPEESGRLTEVEKVYEYFSSNEFQQRIARIVEPAMVMV